MNIKLLLSHLAESRVEEPSPEKSCNPNVAPAKSHIPRIPFIRSWDSRLRVRDWQFSATWL
jgi:hypothetical protein